MQPSTTELNLSSFQEKSYPLPFSILTALFFMIGLLTCLNDILVPHLRAIFELTYVQASLIQFMFFSAYFLMSIPSGVILDRIGYKWGIVLGLITSAGGALLFIPAASVPSYPIFLGALFILASGFTLLQVALNPFIAVLGPVRTASSRLTLSQAFNSLGTTIAPWLGGILILSATALSPEAIKELSPEALQQYRVAEASSVNQTYMILAFILVALGSLFALVKLPNVIPQKKDEENAVLFSEVWKVKHLRFGVFGIFFYVGAEVAIGSYLVNYLGLPEIAGLQERDAAAYVSYYWGGAMVGRFLGAALMQRLEPGRLLGTFALMALVLAVISVVSSGTVAMYSILAVGLCNSIMFPTIFTLAVRGLGIKTGKGSSLLIMAIVGGALIPVLMGSAADLFDLHAAFIIPAACYAYIGWFGFKGSRYEAALA